MVGMLAAALGVFVPVALLSLALGGSSGCGRGSWA
jgi:hypothetical protein